MSANLLTSQTTSNHKSARGEPTWEIVNFFPRQGEWSESDFLSLSTNHFVELNNGYLEFLPMPTALHQAIVRFLSRLLEQFVTQHKLGDVFFAPMPVRLGPGQYREPDIVFLTTERMRALREIGLKGQPEGADLVMEVVSPGTEGRQRDLVEKRDVYAKAHVSEYWIVDPEHDLITVLALEGDGYRVHGEFGRLENATSLLLTGFAVSVRDVFAVADAQN
jgi:Uma2 family endonuclease